MTEDFVAALDREIAGLEAELDADPRIAKLRKLKELRSGFYTQTSAIRFGAASVSPPQPRPDIIGYPAAVTTTRVRRPIPDRDRILSISQAIIEIEGGPVPTISIYRSLVHQGIKLAGDKPVNNLSAILSNSGLFTANGRRGWTMREAGDNPNAVDELDETEELAIESKVIGDEEDDHPF